MVPLSNRFLSLLLLLSVTTIACAAQVHDIRLWYAPDHTRVVFDLSEPVDYTIFPLSNPDRIVIDINNASLQMDLAALNLHSHLQDSPVIKVRGAPRNKHDLRVVLDMKTALKPHSFLLTAQGGHSDRLVIDLYDEQRKSTASKAAVKTIADHDGRRDIMIAIDAGHGGEDPGAVGPGHLQEKHVVLAIANHVHRLLEKERGFDSVMVRSGDYYVGLAARRIIARKAQADLLVSIHADAFHDHRARGGSVYALSHRGATSALAQFLADEANSSDLVGGVNLADKDDLLAGVLIDLSMNHSMNASLQVGDQILQSMGSIAHLHSRKVEQASFKVLKSPDIPSILVETGFISNPDEAKKLGTSPYQQKMAQAIVKGVKAYFTANPPMGTLVAWEKRQQPPTLEYTVARGDTLSGIAQRHRVSMAAIKQTNALKDSDRINVGQVITIPSL